MILLSKFITLYSKITIIQNCYTRKLGIRFGRKLDSDKFFSVHSIIYFLREKERMADQGEEVKRRQTLGFFRRRLHVDEAKATSERP